MHHTFKLMFPFYIIPVPKSMNWTAYMVRGGGCCCFDLYTFDTRQVFQFIVNAAFHAVICNASSSCFSADTVVVVVVAIRVFVATAIGIIVVRFNSFHHTHALHIQLKSKNNKIYNQNENSRSKLVDVVCGGHVTGFTMYITNIHEIKEVKQKTGKPPKCTPLLLLLLLVPDV